MKKAPLNYERQYMDNLKQIVDIGTEEFNERTGVATRRITGTMIKVDLEEEFPILLSKTVNWKPCLREIFWIMQKNSNNIKDLGSKIWDQWADENGSVGKTYGYQVGKQVTDKFKTYTSQVQYVLERLAANPSDRQCVIDMWNPEELGEMNLPPCVYSSIWSIIDGRLNCTVIQRSADYPVGVPFDTTGYAFLTHMFARHLGVRVGTLVHFMSDSHIYVNQLDGVKVQLANWETLKKVPPTTAPKLVFREGAPTNFWAMTPEDIDIVDYAPMGKIAYEVSK